MTNGLVIGEYPTAPGDLGFWFEQSSPSNTNWGLIGTSTNTQFNGTNELIFNVGGGGYPQLEIFSTGLLLPATTAPASVPSSAGASNVWSDSVGYHVENHSEGNGYSTTIGYDSSAVGDMLCLGQSGCTDATSAVVQSSGAQTVINTISGTSGELSVGGSSNPALYWSSSAIQFNEPVYGYSGKAYTMGQTSVTLSANAAITLTTTQKQTPQLEIATISLSGGTSTLNFGGIVGGPFYVDTTNVTFSSQTITLKNGTGSSVVIPSAPTGGAIVTVFLPTTTTIAASNL